MTNDSNHVLTNNLLVFSARTGHLKNFKTNIHIGGDIYTENHKCLKWALVFSHFHIVEYLFELYEDKQKFFSICYENESFPVQYWLNAKILLENLNQILPTTKLDQKKSKL